MEEKGDLEEFMGRPWDEFKGEQRQYEHTLLNCISTFETAESHKVLYAPFAADHDLTAPAYPTAGGYIARAVAKRKAKPSKNVP